MMQLFMFILALYSILPSSMQASPCCEEPLMECCTPKVYANQLFVGPEIYHVHRKREGGTSQSGEAYGVKLGYEHIKRYKLYWAAEAFYGEGRLTGTSASGTKIKSEFIDNYIEGRLGYTLQQKCGYRFAFTPYVGGGYATESNNFIDPTPLHIHFQIRYGYVCGGFLSQMSLNPYFDAGINFKVKYILEGKNYVSNDPDFDDVKMLIKEKFHYRVETPLTYHVCEKWLLSLVPFYEYRHYGGHVNFPFDFADTQLNIFGATFKLIYWM